SFPGVHHPWRMRRPETHAREPDAVVLQVRFDEQRLETEHAARTEAPALPANSYSPQCMFSAPVADSTHRYIRVIQIDLQPLTTLVRVVKRFGQRAAGQQALTLKLFFDPREERLHSRFTVRESMQPFSFASEVMGADLLFDLVETIFLSAISTAVGSLSASTKYR